MTTPIEILREALEEQESNLMDKLNDKYVRESYTQELTDKLEKVRELIRIFSDY